MFFDIGWPELMLVGIVALIVIGPKDMPRALRVAGYWVRKARNVSREVQNSIDQMIREAELDEIRNDLKKTSELDFNEEFHRTIDSDGSLTHSIKPAELPDYFVEHTPAPVEGTAAGAGPEMHDPPPAEGASEPAVHAPAIQGSAIHDPAVHEFGAAEPLPETGIPAPQPLPAKS